MRGPASRAGIREVPPGLPGEAPWPITVVMVTEAERDPRSEPRTLADDLRGRSDDDLAALLKLRPDLFTPVPTDVTSLVARAATRASVTRALERLDRFTLQVVDAFACLPDPTSYSDILALITDRDHLGTAIDRLRELRSRMGWPGRIPRLFVQYETYSDRHRPTSVRRSPPRSADSRQPGWPGCSPTSGSLLTA